MSISYPTVLDAIVVHLSQVAQASSCKNIIERFIVLILLIAALFHPAATAEQLSATVAADHNSTQLLERFSKVCHAMRSHTAESLAAAAADDDSLIVGTTPDGGVLQAGVEIQGSAEEAIFTMHTVWRVDNVVRMRCAVRLVHDFRKDYPGIVSAVDALAHKLFGDDVAAVGGYMINAVNNEINNTEEFLWQSSDPVGHNWLSVHRSDQFLGITIDMTYSD